MINVESSIFACRAAPNRSSVTKQRREMHFSILATPSPPFAFAGNAILSLHFPFLSLLAPHVFLPVCPCPSPLLLYHSKNSQKNLNSNPSRNSLCVKKMCYIFLFRVGGLSRAFLNQMILFNTCMDPQKDRRGGGTSHHFT